MMMLLLMMILMMMMMMTTTTTTSHLLAHAIDGLQSVRLRQNAKRRMRGTQRDEVPGVGASMHDAALERSHRIHHIRTTTKRRHC
jgi:hypothetical protein